MDSYSILPPSVDSFAVSTPAPRRNSTHIPRKSTWGTLIPPPGHKSKDASAENLFETIELSTGSSEESENWNNLDNITALGLSFHGDESPVSQKNIERFSMDATDEAVDQSVLHPDGDRPFNKWMRTLQKRAERRKTVGGDMDADALQREFFDSPGTQRRTSHKKSSSASSFGFVTAVKSASRWLLALKIFHSTATYIHLQVSVSQALVSLLDRNEPASPLVIKEQTEVAKLQTLGGFPKIAHISRETMSSIKL